MKRILIAIAALALLAGCAAKEELTSAGEDGSDNPVATNEGNAPSDQPVADPAVTDGGTPGATSTLAPPKTTTGESKPSTTETKATYAGTYNGRVDIPQESIDAFMKQVPPEQQAQFKAQFEQGLKMVKDVKIVLELMPDGTYKKTITAMGRTEPETGKWHYDEAKKAVVMKSDGPTPEQLAEAKKAGVTDQMIKEAKDMEQIAVVSADQKTMTVSVTQMGMTTNVIYTKN